MLCAICRHTIYIYMCMYGEVMYIHIKSKFVNIGLTTEKLKLGK